MFFDFIIVDKNILFFFISDALEESSSGKLSPQSYT